MTMDSLIKDICAWWEACQRQKRHQRMLRSNPEYRAAYEARERHKRQHKAIRADEIAMRRAVEAMLGGRGVRHG